MGKLEMKMSKKLIIANNDGHGGFFTGKINSVKDLEKFMEGYRDTTLYAFEWCVNLGTKINFLSRNFELFGTGARSDFTRARRGDRKIAKTLANFAKRGVDPLTVVTEKGHEVGIKVCASIRMNPDYDAKWMGT
ncbi:hypothetical protein J7M02_07995 [Candidatus Aerophobetes bacterium]|nr:hypothetical protein [Candidatus Aerophobetes bacterium]